YRSSRISRKSSAAPARRCRSSLGGRHGYDHPRAPLRGRAVRRRAFQRRAGCRGGSAGGAAAGAAPRRCLGGYRRQLRTRDAVPRRTGCEIGRSVVHCACRPVELRTSRPLVKVAPETTMNTQPWRPVRRLAAPILGLLSALCLVPTALAQPRYSNLTWVDRTGKVIETVGAPGEYRGLDVSPDGRRVAAHIHTGAGGDVWLFARSGEGTRLVAEATGVQDNAHP